MAPENGPEPGGWELLRAIDGLKETLSKVLSVEVFKAYSEGNDRRHEANEKALNAWIGESKSEHAELDAKIESERKSRVELERQQRESRQRTWLAIGIAILGPVLGIILNIATKGV